ncbi:hypothetical protein SAG0070_10800 [Streptococcus agalactiae CCUG 44077]|nr:hypothetical protein SAG0051_09140 [Streptococcus agalactiae CCUG 19094]EPT71923.1 hypothetical protein SAG0065_11000 [Streptococcus agalactiae CCUG 37742]EPT78475.1 hypothetical protein SAG0070_10800 [Streptococcus agalactiae CCUG 44077]EPW38538.1 hypothetical protein SAG0072_10580 [Streptococcus agalactiae CCUG 44110]EPW43136.1 hypothetical protein SAG0071_11175 [Streptococcus agalactiae CCUG 44104]EPX23589.1 hypothetical protein SAG0210_10880 [Streptococcus agalactiae str. Gottschalk 132
MEYRNPPTAGEDMPRKPLDGMKRQAIAARGRKAFLSLLPSRRVTGVRGQRPRIGVKGQCPLGTVGGNPDRGEFSCPGTKRGAEPLPPARAS